MNKMMKRLALSASLSLCTFAAFPALAYEPTGNAATDAILEALEASGATDVKVVSVSGSASDPIITGLTAQTETNGEKGSFSIDSIALTNAALNEKGELTADSAVVEKVTVDSDDVNMVAAKVNATKVFIPSADDIKNNPGVTGPMDGSVEFLGINIKSDDGKLVPVDRVYLATSDPVNGFPTKSSLEVDNILVDAGSLDADAHKELTKLGYEKLNMSARASGTLNADTGIMTLDQFQISGTDAGVFSMTAVLGGMTAEVLEKLSQNQDKPEESMAILQGLTVQNLKIDFDNQSIVDRILDSKAKEAGTDRAAFVNQLTTMMPLVLGALQNPEFQKEVSSTVTTFLQDPKNISAEAVPPAPVPFAQVMGIAMMAPQTLPQILNVKLRANQ
ncbi:MAG: hypothetical protein ABJN26_03695 [Stappiaceae bacterium]